MTSEKIRVRLELSDPLNPQTTAMKARIDSREGDYCTAGASALSTPSSAICTITTYAASRSEPDARWMRSGSCLPWCTTYKSCKARRHEEPSEDRSGRLSSNTALLPPRPATKLSCQMIAFRSNNAALEPIAAFVDSSGSAGGLFLQTR
jgi:hypothetical protein